MFNCLGITVNNGLTLPSHLMSMGFGQDEYILNILLEHSMFIYASSGYFEEYFDRNNEEYSVAICEFWAF